MERTNKREKLVIGAALGECVHVAGVVNFLRLADEQGYKTVSLGPAVSVRELVGAIVESDPELVAVGYRLTPSTAEPLFAELKRELERAGVSRVRLVSGGTAPWPRWPPDGLFERVQREEASKAVAYSRATKWTAAVVPADAGGAHSMSAVPSFRAASLGNYRGRPANRGGRVLDVLSIGTDRAALES